MNRIITKQPLAAVETFFRLQTITNIIHNRFKTVITHTSFCNIMLYPFYFFLKIKKKNLRVMTNNKINGYLSLMILVRVMRQISLIPTTLYYSCYDMHYYANSENSRFYLNLTQPFCFTAMRCVHLYDVHVMYNIKIQYVYCTFFYVGIPSVTFYIFFFFLLFFLRFDGPWSHDTRITNIPAGYIT